MTNYSEYLRDPLDNEYLIVPRNSVVEEGALPPEEFQIRRALAALNVIFTEEDAIGALARIFKTQAYKEWETRLSQQKKVIKELVFSSKLHKAAYNRIVNAIPGSDRDDNKAFWDSIGIREKNPA